jgi:hypothetical protein
VSEPRVGGAALVLEPQSPRPSADIGRVLAYHLGLHPTDAIARARYGGGVLFSGIAEEVAESLAAQLARVGVQARRVDAALLADLPRGHRARSLEFSQGAIRAQVVPGSERLVPRESLFGVHLYALSEGRGGPSDPPPGTGFTGRLRALPGLRALARRSWAAGPEEERALAEARWFRRQHHDLGEELELTGRGQKLREALLTAGDPPPRLFLTLLTGSDIGPLRLRQEEIDYSPLGEGKTAHSLDNFLRLIEELRTFQPEAWMVDRLAGFLERLDPAEILYFKPEEAQNLERWMQLWIRIREEER